MEYVFVTVRYGSKHQTKDLMLPYRVPSQILADHLAKALKLRIESNMVWSLSLEENGHRNKIPYALSLGDATPPVLCGDFLTIEAETSPGYLEAENGTKFLLKQDNNVLGRGVSSRVNIDLTAVDDIEAPITSRYHADIVFNEDCFEIMDHNSVNGTYVNGFELLPSKRYELKDCDVIELGPHENGGVRLVYHWNGL